MSNVLRVAPCKLCFNYINRSDYHSYVNISGALRTLVEVLGGLARVPTSVGAALLLGRAFPVLLAALHTGRREATGPLRRRAVTLFDRQHRLEELTAGHALPVLLGERTLGCGGGGGGGGRREEDK